MLIYLILFIPFFIAWLAFFLNKKYAKKLLKIFPLFYLLLFILVLYFYSKWIVLENKFLMLDFSKGLFDLNSINIVFFTLVLIMSFIVGKYADFYFTKEINHKEIWLNRLKQFIVLFNLFIWAMLFVASTKNIIVMWIALEATTIFTTFLISFYGTKTSWEASWKYVVLCSVWLTIWLFGIILLINAGLESLYYNHIVFDHVNVLLTKLAFIFILVWFGTKVGLFPMHTWLPDAHGKASTPVSALMSSILLPLALYVIIKIKIIVDTMLWNSDFTNNILIFAWIITVLYAWFTMIVQKHFKRALAYSTSENMWIILILFGLASPLAVKLAILHIIAHSFFKWASFMSVWNILVEQWTGQFDKIWNLTKNMKITSILTIISIIFLLWFPISPLFISEIWVVALLFAKNIFLWFTIILALILVFVWVLINFSKMFKEKEDDKTKFIDEKLKCKTIYIPIIISIIFGLLSAWILFI